MLPLENRDFLDLGPLNKVERFVSEILLSTQMAGMFRIDQDGQVTRSDVGAGSHEARVVAGVPLPGDLPY